MPVLFGYLVKCSLGLSVVWLFYRLALKRLTFYQWNRGYLLCCSLLAFFIPFINISPALGVQAQNGLPAYIPALEKYIAPVNTYTVHSNASGFWNMGLYILLAGITLLIGRLFIQYLSFLRIRRSASIIYRDKITLYHVPGNIAPFSFGNAVFINASQHSEAELQKIIRHEFVHAEQKHTLDIVFAELLCIVCWYNPFAWLIRNSIRQNLEFITDEQVLQHGVARKEYQYLLLKVVGDNRFSIGARFGISSLKERIGMMNRLRSAKTGLYRFLFLLPLAAVLLLAFRQQLKNNAAPYREPRAASNMPRSIDTPPPAPLPPPAPEPPFKLENGVKSIVVKANRAEVTFYDKSPEVYNLGDAGEKKKFYSRYGRNEEKPLQPQPNNEQVKSIAQPAPPEPTQGQPAPESYAYFEGTIKGAAVTCINNQVTVKPASGAPEKYNLDIPAEKQAFRQKYGGIPAPPPPPPPPPAPASWPGDDE